MAKKTKKSSVKKKSVIKPAKKKIAKKAVAKRKLAKVAPIPKGYHSITPYLIIEGAAQAIAFYKKVFGAKEMLRLESPDKKIMHAELKIGDARIMLSDGCSENTKDPKQLGGSPVGIHLYIKQVDNIVKRAVDAGAQLIKPLENMFWGDRMASIEDPFGHRWSISMCVEKVTPAKVRKRVAALF